MTMKPKFGPAALMPAALLAMMILTGCASTAPAPITRRLPAVDLVIPEPTPRPELRKGDDARIVARKALDYGDQNAARLRQGRDTYRAIVEQYGDIQ